MESEKLNLALDSILSTWQQGRRVLVVLGAGASVSAGIPDMTAVFKSLKTAVEELNGKFVSGEGYPEDSRSNAEKPKIGRGLTELCERLDALTAKNAPRSVAAMTLGTLQRSHLHVGEQGGQRWFHQELSEIWTAFSKRFVDGGVSANSDGNTGADEVEKNLLIEARKRIAAHSLAPRIKQSQIRPNLPLKRDGPLRSRDPTPLHNCVAGWALQDWADLVSLNFDGLTRTALDRCSDPSKVVPVVLTEPKALQNYFLGNPIRPNDAKRVVPVIKVWGDVFHAVCTSQQCPEFGNRIPIYEVDASRYPEGCPSCHASRQLQIFFTGYEEKERTTDELMRGLLKYVAPRIGCIVTIGFSGLWDQTLVNFLATVCKDLNWENKHPGQLGQRKHASWICIDPDEIPPLLQDLAAHGITPTHIPTTGDEFASLFDLHEFQIPPVVPQNFERYGRHPGSLEDGKWHEPVNNMAEKQEYIFPQAYECFADQDYLRDFKYLRQLGIKTKIALARSNREGKKENEEDHNRKKHSWGTTTLSALWFRKLAKGQLRPEEMERIATVVVFAAMHHDVGHLPFTHLAEEIFQEVHWSLEDWADAFRHDEPVLGNCIDLFREQIDKSTATAARLIQCQPDEFRNWVEGAIQGRSGYPWIDAILNSPLDVDKLDYVFRDCDFLGQGIHVSTKENRFNWVQNLFSHTRVLPSGLVALTGEGGEQARDFLEERRWLYKHQYYQSGYRALERLAGAVTLQWLLHQVSDTIVSSSWYFDVHTKLKHVVNDTSAKKGAVARTLLWTELLTVERDSNFTRKGEPGLLLHLTDALTHPLNRGVPANDRVIGWAKRCFEIFNAAFDGKQEQSDLTLLQFLTQTAGMTCSEAVYVSFDDLKKVREIVRQLETLRPYRALFDIAVMPRMLSYPSRRRLKWGGATILGECFAVAHRDPDRWGTSASQWIPMSESAFGERDKARWAKIMVISPEANDPEVAHALDRFRTLCRSTNIRISDVDPDEAVR